MTRNSPASWRRKIPRIRRTAPTYGREIGIVCALLCRRKNKGAGKSADWNLSFHFSWRDTRVPGRHVRHAKRDRRLAVLQRRSTESSAVNSRDCVEIRDLDDELPRDSARFGISVTSQSPSRRARHLGISQHALLSVVKCLLLSRLGYPELERAA